MACCWSQEALCALEFHNYEAIIKNSDKKIRFFSKFQLYKHLRTGLFLNGKKQKYWVDKNSNNCFMIFAEGLDIVHIQYDTYWKWEKEETRKCLFFPQHGGTKLAELKLVWWLEVKGYWDASFLSPNVTYEVIFVIKLRQDACGWSIPVNLILCLPDGNTLRRQEMFDSKEKEVWHRILVGEFHTTSENNKGTIKVLLEETSSIQLGGLVIKGVIISPKYDLISVAENCSCMI